MSIENVFTEWLLKHDGLELRKYRNVYKQMIQRAGLWVRLPPRTVLELLVNRVTTDDTV